MGQVHYEDIDDGVRLLPEYAQSLLKIRVPVVVTLATSKQPIGRVVELSPGSIIQFDKPCEDMLTLEVSNCDVAVGEAVKVGDKFGLRVTSITMPEERFTPVATSPSHTSTPAQDPESPASDA